MRTDLNECKWLVFFLIEIEFGWTDRMTGNLIFSQSLMGGGERKQIQTNPNQKKIAVSLRMELLDI